MEALKPIDTSVFSSEYNYDISLGRLFVSYWGVLFSSEVINGLNIDPNQYIDALKSDGIKIEELGSYITITYTDKDNGDLSEWEYIITIIDKKIIVGVREKSFRILYSQDTSIKIIQRLTYLYQDLKI